MLKRIQGIVASVVAVTLVLSGLVIAPLEAQAATLFSDGFDSNPDGYVNWTSGNPENGNWEIDNSGHTGKAARVKGNNTTTKYLYKNISTAGQQDIVVSYWYKADDLESNDNDVVKVEWSETGAIWNTLFTIDDNNDDDQWHSKSHNLPATANNKSGFKIRAWADLNSGNDKVWLDDFVVTSSPILGTLTVIKIVVNDDGGVKTVFDFPLFVNGNPVMSGVAINSYVPGNYTVTETASAGYAPTFSGDCDANGNVTLASGDIKVCILTNDDIPAKLTVTKTVVNDDSGVKSVGDFGLFVGNTQVSSGVQNNFNPNSYTVTENNASGYTAVFGGDCAADGSITLSAGDVKNCTIENNDDPLPPPPPPAEDTLQLCSNTTDDDNDELTDLDDPDCAGFTPKLTVTKVVVNDDGRTKVISDFPLFVGLTSVVSGIQNAFAPGSYTVSETVDPDYTSLIGEDCATDGSITLSIGDVKECTITNDDTPIPAPTEDTLQLCSNTTDDDNDQLTDLDDPDCAGFTPKLTVTKVVVNNDNGVKTVGDFPLFVDQNPVSSGVQNTYSAGAHTVSETADPDYTGTIGGDCAADGSVTLSAGDVKECTITNDDNAPVQQSNNNSGGGSGGGSTPPGNGAPGAVTVVFGGAGGGNGPIGLVLGASTTTNSGESAPATTCSAYLNSYLRIGGNNPTEEVNKLQQFLNEYMGANLPVTGVFGSMTDGAVKDFQVKEAGEVLNPWVAIGLHADSNVGTGYVYKTTLRRINMIKCSALNLPIPQLP